MSATELPDPPLAALTAEEFNDGAGYTFRGVPIIESEDADWVYAYGHVDDETMAGAVTDYDREVSGDASLECTEPDEVQHLYAVTVKAADDPDGWWINWGNIAEDTPGAFPITLVSR